MTANVTVVSDGGNWEGIYINGVCVLQDHSISARKLLDELANLGIVRYNGQGCDEDWLHGQGYLPKKLDDVVFDE